MIKNNIYIKQKTFKNLMILIFNTIIFIIIFKFIIKYKIKIIKY